MPNVLLVAHNPCRDLLGQPTITVKVGPSAKEYHIHKPLLVRYSGFFRGALSSNAFKSAVDGVVILEDVEPGTFDAFADQDLAPLADWATKYPHPYPDPRFEGEMWIATTRLTWWYVFADRFIVPEMQQYLIHLGIGVFSQYAPCCPDLTYAWKHLPTNSPFLRLLVDAYCENWYYRREKGEPQLNEDSLPRGCLLRIMRRLGDLWTRGVESAIRDQRDYDEAVRDVE
ncbi:hypothetical protein BU26DRAFT_558112 [Trematosphaeria pertusa]|uniref:BTB domain-containing protein n=1 Tax=Trematosphaeria pertusa TaxID=390896 RepID=A0A6A6J2V0_9PLEO|nr:uncharacterized protein BU26DRAFT_558112 [Trematosphaeria pertusa]KAF2256667.1 hypothetical protein BU26DRAFT_558112 [Trematosphaeria pertusa]